MTRHPAHRAEIPVDRLSGDQDRLHYAGKHRRHGVNVQIIADVVVAI